MGFDIGREQRRRHLANFGDFTGAATRLRKRGPLRVGEPVGVLPGHRARPHRASGQAAKAAFLILEGDDGDARAANLKRGAGSLLRVSALPSIALDAIPSTVAQFLRKHPDTRFDLQTVHHNQLRLLKLVNALLDFSRLEAGRMAASYTRVDLTEYTTDLASAFRSAFERAGFQTDHVEGFREDYSKTLTEWAKRFDEHLVQAERLVGPERTRVWRLYLRGARYSFDAGLNAVYQVRAHRPAAPTGMGRM